MRSLSIFQYLRMYRKFVVIRLSTLNTKRLVKKFFGQRVRTYFTILKALYTFPLSSNIRSCRTDTVTDINNISLRRTIGNNYFILKMLIIIHRKI